MTSKWTTHLPRRTCETLVVGVDDAVLISITDSIWPPNDADIAPGVWRDVLRLRFDDMTKEEVRWPTPLSSSIVTEFVYPNETHAREIASFIRRHWERPIVAHCEAGISRSAAISAVLVALGWEYRNPGIGLQHANPLLVRLLKAEFPELMPVGVR